MKKKKTADASPKKTKRPPRPKGRAVRYNRHYEVPAGNDPRWEDWARPILEYLQEPRDWGSIITWAKTNKVGLDFLREVLAWAALYKRAVTTKQMEDGREVSIWRATTVADRRPPPPNTRAVVNRCTVCQGLLGTDDRIVWKCVLCGRRYAGQP